MTLIVDQSAFAMGVRTPKHENDWLGAPRHLADDRIREHLPTSSAVTGGLGLFYGEAGVK